MMLSLAIWFVPGIVSYILWQKRTNGWLNWSFWTFIIATKKPTFRISEKIATFITCYHLAFYEICVFVVLYAE
jgi:hypothetical protein